MIKKEEEYTPVPQSKLDKDFMDTYNKILDMKFEKMKVLNKQVKSKSLEIDVHEDIISGDRMGDE